MTRSLPVWMSVSCLLLVCVPAGAETVLVNDPLNQSTVGVEDGSGVFHTDGGWYSTGGKIVIDAGQLITNGYFECQMRGWTAPAQGVDKSHPLSGWENKDQYGHYLQTGSFWNWRIGTGYNPFKVLAAPQSIDTRVEARVGSNDAVNGADSHTYRVQWNNGNIKFIFDGNEINQWTFNRFAERYFCLGRDDQYGISDPAPIISDVIIVDMSSGDSLPTIVTSALGQATVGLPYNANLQAVGGDAPLSWSLASGSLPPGLDLNGDVIGGTPTSAGNYDFKARVTDTDGDQDERDLTIVVNAASGQFTAVFGAEADVHIDARSPDVNFGAASDLSVGGGTAERVIFIRFDVSGLPGNAVVTDARLIFNTSNGGYGGVIRKFAPATDAWDQMQPTWNNRLAGSDASGDLFDIGLVPASGTNVFTGLDSAISGNGRVTFVIRSDQDDGAAYMSSENTNQSLRPVLQVTYEVSDEDGGIDAGFDAGSDAGGDVGSDPGGDAGSDPGGDAGSDPGPPPDGSADAGSDPGPDVTGDGCGCATTPEKSVLAFCLLVLVFAAAWSKRKN